LKKKRLNEKKASRTKQSAQKLAEEKKRKEAEELALKIEEMAKTSGTKAPKNIKEIKAESFGIDEIVKSSLIEVVRERKKKRKKN